MRQKQFALWPRPGHRLGFVSVLTSQHGESRTLRTELDRGLVVIHVLAQNRLNNNCGWFDCALCEVNHSMDFRGTEVHLSATYSSKQICGDYGRGHM